MGQSDVFGQELPELPLFLGNEKIAILGAILSRATPQNEAHATRLCADWGVELSSVRALALQTYRETEAEQ